MKIVRTDNIPDDYPSESFLNLPPLPEDCAKKIASAINDCCSGPLAPDYWKVVDNDYTLAEPFEP